jgi:hypothetical protein
MLSKRNHIITRQSALRMDVIMTEDGNLSLSCSHGTFKYSYRPLSLAHVFMSFTVSDLHIEMSIIGSRFGITLKVCCLCQTLSGKCSLSAACS